jgi:hypothetical protein
MPRWLWFVIGCTLLAVLSLVPTIDTTNVAKVLAARSSRDSTKRVRDHARQSMDALLHGQTKPYREWDEIDRGHYQALRNVRREVGEDCPEVPP